MKRKPQCNCKECGADLYSKENIDGEIKATLGRLYSDTIPERIGRPMYGILMGDIGLCIVNSPDFSGGDDIMIECLESVIKQLKSVPRTPQTF